MAFTYNIDFKHIDAQGREKVAKTLAGSHDMTLSVTPGPLDVSLIEIVPPPGEPAGKFGLTVTEVNNGPRSDQAGAWAYQIFFSHQNPSGAVDQSALATGSHFTKMSSQTASVEVKLDELTPQGNQNPRLHFTFKDG